MLRNSILVLLFLFGFCAQANAVSCFWVGGTANWDGTNTGGGGTGGIKWASGTGGITTCAGAGTGGSPGTTDSATFDALSGGGTVTITIDISIQIFTWGAFTGTIDNSANNKNVTLSSNTGFSGSGNGARTFLGGSGTYTLSNAAATWFMTTTTNLTNPTTAFSSCTITLSGVATTGGAISFQGGGLTYGTVNLNANKGVNIVSANTFATLNITGPNQINLPAGVTTTITNAFAWTGTSATPILISNAASTTTITTGSATVNTAAWAGFERITFTPVGGSTFTATNSLDFGLNSGTGFTITPPSGGGKIIGG